MKFLRNGNIIRKNRAIVLLSVVIILIMISLIGTSLVAFFSLVNFSARNTVDEVKAFYLAEAGIAQALNMIRNKVSIKDDADSKIGPIQLGSGTYEVEIDPLNLLITATGRVGNTKKTLQIFYSTL